MTQTVELTPSGINTTENKPAQEITESGASVVRETKDLFKYWSGQESRPLPPIDDAAVVSNIEDAPSLENEILFGLIRDPRVQLLAPIPVEITREGDTVVASWAEAEEFGHGKDRSEALEDFGRTVSQLFISLSKNEKELGPDLARVLSILRKHLKHRVTTANEDAGV